MTSVTEAWQQRQQRQKRRSDGNGGSARGGDGGSRSDNNGGVSVLWCMRAGVNGACSSHAVLPPVVNHIGSLPQVLRRTVARLMVRFLVASKRPTRH